jgi:hypothetical protein
VDVALDRYFNFKKGAFMSMLERIIRSLLNTWLFYKRLAASTSTQSQHKHF